MSRWLDDVRYGLRSLMHAPGFTVICLLTLALSIGANTAIFSYVDAVLLRPPPYDHPERIVQVLESPPGGGRNGISTLNFLDWQKQNSCFEYLAAQTGGSATLTGHGEPVEISGARVSAHFFDVFGVRAEHGRTFLAGEDQLGKERVVVLSYRLWQSQFGGDPALVGKSIELDNEKFEVVGILPRGSPFDRNWARMWRPLAFKPDNMTRNFHWMGAHGRLKPGVTLEQARLEMDTIGRRIAADFPDSNKGWGVGVDLLRDTIAGPDLRRTLIVMLSAVGMVLLIACANLTNLSLMRVVRREREIAIRLSLGASRWALARQFLVESLLLSLVGGLAGILTGKLALLGLQVVVPPFSLPSEAEVTLDGRVLLFSLGLSVLSGLAIGLLPAWNAARPSLTHALKQGGNAGATAHARVRHGLVVVEIALAFVLLAGAGLLIRSLDKLRNVDPGFDTTNVLTFGLPIGNGRFPDMTTRVAFLNDVRERIAALPGVRDVALTSALPMQGWGYGMPYLVEGTEKVDRANRRACFFKMVTPTYFQTIGVRILRGRSLAETDRHGATPVTVINESFARKHFADKNPIGQRILVQEIVPNATQLGEEIPWEIVGVVANEYVGGLDQKTEDNPGMYVANEQSPASYLAMAVRGNVDTALLREPIKQAIRQVSAEQVVQEMKTLAMIKEESLGSNRSSTILLGIFAGLSLLLAAIGIYGVLAYAVSQRTREIGIRTALGATPGSVLRLVLRHGLWLTALGLAVGLAGATALTRLLASLLFGVGAWDVLTLGAVAVILGAVATLACFIPARRATRVDPLVALRTE